MGSVDYPVPRVALVGISGYGSILLTQILSLQSAGRLDLVAAVVINEDQEEKTCQQLRSKGCRLYATLSAMLETESHALTLCLLPTPIHLHRRMAEEVLSAGVNVLLEKPVAATTHEVDGIIWAARQHRRLVAVGFQNLYAEEVQQLKRCVVGGALGRVRAIDVLVLWPRSLGYYARNEWAGRLHMPDGCVLDSPLNNAAAHFMMMALFLAGPSFTESARVIALEGGVWRAQRIESFDTATVSFLTASDCRLNFLVTHSCRNAGVPVLRIQGDQGTAEWRLEEGVRIRPVNGPETFLRAAALSSDRANMIAKVLDRIADGKTFVCTPELAREHTRCIAAIHDHLVIKDVPADLVKMASVGSERQQYIDCVEDVLQRCWNASALPYGLSSEWGGALHRHDLRGYKDFSTSRPQGEGI